MPLLRVIRGADFHLFIIDLIMCLSLTAMQSVTKTVSLP